MIISLAAPGTHDHKDGNACLLTWFYHSMSGMKITGMITISALFGNTTDRVTVALIVVVYIGIRALEDQDVSVGRIFGCTRPIGAARATIVEGTAVATSVNAIKWSSSESGTSSICVFKGCEFCLRW